MEVKKLKKIYLAIPYTGMRDSAFRQANVASVEILNLGHNVFSPITHSHPLTLLERYEIPHTWEYWQHIDYQYLDWADELWILVPEEGIQPVKKSTGVQAEIAYAKKLGIPILYVSIDELMKKTDERLKVGAKNGLV